jgi:hypothetical protein
MVIVFSKVHRLYFSIVNKISTVLYGFERTKERLGNCFFNPWNHRADISAQAYLKPSKMGKINVTELFLLNTL